MLISMTKLTSEYECECVCIYVFKFRQTFSLFLYSGPFARAFVRLIEFAVEKSEIYDTHSTKARGVREVVLSQRCTYFVVVKIVI